MTGCLFTAVSRLRSGNYVALVIRCARMTVRDKQPLEQMLAGCTPLHWCQHNSGVCWLTAVPFPESGVTWRRGYPGRVDGTGARQGIRCFCGYGLTEFASTVCGKKPTAWQTLVRRCRVGK